MSAELVKSFEIIFGHLTATERKWLIDHIGGLKANAGVALSEENDRLIAANERLRAALKASLEFYDTLPKPHHAGEAAVLDLMKAAITKAEAHPSPQSDARFRAT